MIRMSDPHSMQKRAAFLHITAMISRLIIK